MGNSKSSGAVMRVTSELRERYAVHGQQHLFRFLDQGSLSDAEETLLAQQLSEVDVGRALGIFEGSMASASREDAAADKLVTPLDAGEVASPSAVAAHAEEWSAVALESMSRGEVAFVVLSGGQGTRLGFSRAKGMYDIGLPSHKTLFRLQGERLRKLHELVRAAHPSSLRVSIPWYIMTSPLNDADTRGFFAENGFFGLKEEDVVFFAQGTLPCMTTDGDFMLESKAKLAFAPDGNGGIYRAMEESGVMADMAKRGVTGMHVAAVDNALVQPADPLFVGYCQSQGADAGNKGCPKVAWDEAVGVMARKGGKFNIVEYSELDEALAKTTAPDGRLLFSTGNICNHYFTLAFLRDVALPALVNSYHIAHKKIAVADPKTGEPVKPAANNGIKLEMFIFDVFPLTERMAVFECARAEEFAPVKNAPGSPTDSPDSARNMTFALHRGWLEAAGAKLEGAPGLACEVTPRVSLRGEGLADIASSVPLFALPALLCYADETSAAPSPQENVSTSPDVVVHHFVDAHGINIYSLPL